MITWIEVTVITGHPSETRSPGETGRETTIENGTEGTEMTATTGISGASDARGSENANGLQSASLRTGVAAQRRRRAARRSSSIRHLATRTSRRPFWQPLPRSEPQLAPFWRRRTCSRASPLCRWPNPTKWIESCTSATCLRLSPSETSSMS